MTPGGMLPHLSGHFGDNANYNYEYQAERLRGFGVR